MRVEEHVERPGAFVRWRTMLESRSPFLMVFVPLTIIYLATANLSSYTHIDPLTNSLTAWHLGMTGSVVLPDHAEAAVEEQRGNVAWVIDSPRGPVSQYPPGAAALAAPFYWAWDQPMTEWFVEGFNNPDAEPIPFPLPSPAPSAIAMALATAAAMGLVAAAIPHAGGTRLSGVAAGYVGGLATTMWATSSDAIWQHGPASLWVGLAVYLAARSHLLWSGLAFGAAVMTRPPLAVVAAVVGLYLSVSRRTWRPAASIGAGSLLGLGGLVWFNWWLWRDLSVSGGYGEERLRALASADDAVSYIVNLTSSLVDPAHGVLLYSPFLLLLIPGIRAGWRQVPDWARAATVGGVVYLLVQLRVNRFSGGEGFLGYRYPLETMTAGAVVLTSAYTQWVQVRPLARLAFWVAVVVSVSLEIYWKAWVVPGYG